MDLPLESLSREELIALLNKERQVPKPVDIGEGLASRPLHPRQLVTEERIAELGEENAYLKSQLAMYKRMQYGQKRERFEGDPAQIALHFEAPAQQTADQEEILKEKISYVRNRPTHKGRAALPSHLPVEEIEIYPQGNLSEMVCICKEVTEELDYEPARFLIKDISAINTLPKRRGGSAHRFACW